MRLTRIGTPVWLVALAALVVVAPLASAEEGSAEEPGMRVTASGVGTGVEDHALVGEGTEFPEGTEVFFWTKVEGGQAGDRIVHRWSREGEERVSIGLSIGGPHWRTYSRKSLRKGDAGSWKVEALTEDGKVLATAEFTCVAPSGDEPG